MAATQIVHDAISNENESLEHHANVLKRSERRKKVFKSVYKGKTNPKTVVWIAEDTGLSRKAVLDVGLQLHEAQMVRKDRISLKHGAAKQTVYFKTAFCKKNRSRILALAENPKKLVNLSTKRSPKTAITQISVKQVAIPKALFEAKQLTVDDIDSFSAVRSVQSTDKKLDGLSETAFKNGIKSIIGEAAEFKDWGGEKSDLMTTRVQLNGTRISAAFAFKGPGLKAKLVPGKMGKNGDQAQRLFSEPVELLMVHHWREIDSSVLELIQNLAIAKSVTEGRKIYFGLIDGQDSNRLVAAYAKHFQ
ncbi:MAG: hypothetical protein ACTS1X_04040 [Parasphingopyxis sp.]|uniref:hypothetical protein n=1 Tax=Parasphingopyxis sp. TaxID=1920299 RepID=UPI003FA053C3